MDQPMQTEHQAQASDNATFKVVLLGVQPGIAPSEAKITLAALW